MTAPAAVLLDVNETLFSLDPVRQRLPDGVLDRAFARVLRDGFALACTEVAGDFPALLEHHLATEVGDEEAEHALGALRELPAHPDVRPALERLAGAGVRVATLTNGSAELTNRLLDGAGLGHLVAATLQANDHGAWKPAEAPYVGACAELGLASEATALVAVHSWDVHGAARAGLRTGWCRRLEGTRPPGLDPADVEGDDLVAVVHGLLAD